MGRFPRLCPNGRCFRFTWTPSNEMYMQALPKPKEAGDVADGVAASDKEKEPDILIIREIDPCININGGLHHTSKYEVMNREIDPQLVVRRGQNFALKLTLNRPYDEERDGVSFIFTVEDEDKPSHGNGTMVAVPLLKKADRHLPWNVTVDNIDGNTLTVQVKPAPDCVVAKWRMDVDTKLIDNGAYSYSWTTGIYIIFNPWCKLDQVYMKSDEWKEEAVLNESGMMWRGTYNRVKPVIWKYDQFEKDILDCSLYLVREIGNVKSSFRADPVHITRALAAAVNAADDLGAVQGNWSNDYSGGTPPTKWIGSKEILQKYYKKKKPVKYGQCWVFAGVLTTICRSLGIPARPVTNYSSAHDTQNSLTVDYFADASGAMVEELNSDSIWTYHVWTEAWMERLDLGAHYGGWQAIDATPQELSGESYKCGPASVVAVKMAEILKPYDGNFLFAEVNADKIFWKYSGPTQPLKLLRKDIYGIGKMICTKSPTSFEREDITYTYKHPEKTTEERTTMLKALQQTRNLFSRYYLNEDFNDIHFNFKLLDDIKIGQTFNACMEIKNRSSSKEYKVTVTLRVDVVSYTGRIGDNVKSDTFAVSIKPSSTHEVKLPVTYEEYSKQLLDQSAFTISCMATIEDSKFEYFAQDDFRIRKPDIKIVLKNPAVRGQEVTAEIYVENPLPVPLKKGEFTVEGPGIERKLKIRIKDAVPPGGQAKGEFKFTPQTSGRDTIAAKFVCRQMDDVDGYLEIDIAEPNDRNGR
ncbi:unnamed protein product [Callosobruchus maculatus]|uniref:protein-glutamine gamma-glutamyltransferase n=1 Tax=Callosobruchus maculatus TaxID=64391 RepID=A0A653BT54_CALMS|nr:unnamed protein product [Callosobruchus maculatus]